MRLQACTTITPSSSEHSHHPRREPRPVSSLSHRPCLQPLAIPVGFLPLGLLALHLLCQPAMRLEGTASLQEHRVPSESVHGVACQCNWKCFVQFSSVAESCPTLCDPMDCSTPGFPVHHQLLEFTQTHVLRVSDAIQPCHPLSSPSPPAPNPSQHESFPMSQLFA